MQIFESYMSRFLALCVVALFGSLVAGLAGCPSAVCQEGSCPTGQTCVAGQCQTTEGVTPSDGGTDRQPQPEPAPDTPGAEEPNSNPEPPPFPDSATGDNKLTPPETLRDGQNPNKPGARAEGESCNPTTTALAADKCAEGLLCVAPRLGPVGICRKRCDPTKDDCAAGTQCGEIISPDFGVSLGHACGILVEEGYPCTFGFHCKKGLNCVRYSNPNEGVCQKACAKREDCGNGWCASVKGLTGDLLACMRLIEKVQDSCENDTICGTGLTCHGSSPNRLCLKTGCTQQSPCPQGETCDEIKDVEGKLLYAACFPIIPAFGACHSANRCEKDHVCATFNGSARWSACVKNCTKDATVCGAQETCADISSSAKGCLRTAQETESCEGPAQCAQGLQCMPISPQGPRFCMKDCSADATVCQSPATCQALANGQDKASACLTPCNPQDATPCTQSSALCKSFSGSNVCLPNPDKEPGQRKVTESCQVSPAAPAAERCEPSLQCFALRGGARCLQTCAPNQPNCPNAQVCTLDPQTKTHVCAAEKNAAESCDISLAESCKTGHFCQIRSFSSQGTCVPVPTRALNQWCLSEALACAPSLVCAGDASVPFRWICRTPCDPAKTGECSAQEACLQTTQSGACFATCTPATPTCTPASLRCTEVQQKNVCL